MRGRDSFTAAEVSAYYAARVPSLKQRNRGAWRGPCPVHGGKGFNFAVKPENGFWYCYSQCGRGGDVLALEIALTGATFRNAESAVFQIVGRSSLASPQDGRTRAQRACDRRDADLAEFWRTEMLRIIEAELSACKAVLFSLPESEIEQAGGRVRALTDIQRQLESLRRVRLLNAYRREIRRDAIGTRRIVLDGISDESDAEHWVATIVRLLGTAASAEYGRCA